MVGVGEGEARDRRRGRGVLPRRLQARRDRGPANHRGGVRGQPLEERRGAEPSGRLRRPRPQHRVGGRRGGGLDQLAGARVAGGGEGDEGDLPFAAGARDRPRRHRFAERPCERPGARRFEGGHPHPRPRVGDELQEARLPFAWRRGALLSNEALRGAQGLDDRARVGVVEQRPEARQVGRLPNRAEAARRPGADPAVRVGEQQPQRARRAGQRVAPERVGGLGVELGAGEDQRALGERHPRFVLEAEEVRQEARPALPFVERQERLGNVHRARAELAQRLDGQDAGLAVGIAQRRGERRHRGLVLQLPEREGGGAPHPRLVVDQQPLQHPPPA